jgi:tRNA 2-thiouridine synthesizing protein A
MSSDTGIKEDEVADLSGYSCPMVVMLTEKFVNALPPGSVALVISTDPIARIDIPAWVWKSKNKLLKEARDGGAWKFFIEKTVAPG